MSLTVDTHDSSEDVLQGQRRWYVAHPAWVVPIIFLAFWSMIGPMSILQGLAVDFYDKEAQTITNIPKLVDGLFGFICTPVMGAISDRFGRKPVLLVSVLVGAFPWVLLWLANLTQDGSSYYWFLAAQVVPGLTGSVPGILGLCFTYVADCVPASKRGPICGMIMAFGAGLGFSASPMFFSWVYAGGAQHQLSVQCMAASALLSVLVVILMPESHPRSRRIGLTPLTWVDVSPVRSFNLLFGERSDTRRVLRLLFVAMFLCYMVKIGEVATLGIFATQVYQFDTARRGKLMLCYGVFQFLAQFSLPLLLKLFSKRVVIGVGLFAAVIATGVPAIPSVPVWGLFVSEAFLAVPFIVYTMSTTVAMQVVPAHKVGEASMLISTALTLSSALGPLLFGMLSSATVKTSYPGGAFLVLFGITVLDFVLGFWVPSDSAIDALHDAAMKVQPDHDAKAALLQGEAASLVASFVA